MRTTHRDRLFLRRPRHPAPPGRRRTTTELPAIPVPIPSSGRPLLAHHQKQHKRTAAAAPASRPREQKSCSIRSKVIFLHGRWCSIRAGAAGGGWRRSGLLFFPAVEKRPRPVDPRALVLAVAATRAAREAAQHVGVADDPEEEEECLVRRSGRLLHPAAKLLGDASEFVGRMHRSDA